MTWQSFYLISATAAVHFLPDFQAANFRELGALQWGQKTSYETLTLATLRVSTILKIRKKKDFASCKGLLGVL